LFELNAADEGMYKQWLTTDISTYNNVIWGHFSNNVSQRLWFALLQQRAPAITSGHGGCLIPRKNATDRHVRVHKVFFFPARAWKTPDNRG
jgi:hypothetical protein